jgi:hypothetical protein
MRRKSSRFETSVLAAIEKNYNNLLQGTGDIWAQSPVISKQQSAYLSQSPDLQSKNLSGNDSKFFMKSQEEAKIVSSQVDLEKKNNDLKIFLQNSSKIEFDTSTDLVEANAETGENIE